MIRQEVTDGWIIYDPLFVRHSLADIYFSYLQQNLPWRGGEIKLFGKVHQIPRKQVMMANQGLSYAYSGKTLQSESWDDQVIQIKSQIEDATGYAFNACLANLYRDGQDSNGWHADNEKELGENPIIASVSFGATRKFQLKHSQKGEKLSFDLSHGSLLVMGGKMQHYWKHQVPKTKKVDQPRVNLTFRKLYV